MIAVVQRVSSASVTTQTPPRRASIGTGLLALVAVEPADGDQAIAWMARKLSGLRVFQDAEGRMNRSVSDCKGQLLLVSQFTLAGDCTKGNRPSFVGAADPAVAAPILERLAHRLEASGIPVKTGVFGAHMSVDLVNDGPVTLILQTPQGS